jgi:hypothetical protein
VLTESEVHAKLEKELEDVLQGRTLHEAINPLLGMDGDIVRFVLCTIELIRYLA